MELITLPPDLKQNIFYMTYFIMKHNFLAIIFTACAIISLAVAIIKPSRSAVFMFVGFLLLLFSFEYIKHIREPLRDQTIGSLITIQPHNKVTRIVNFILNKGLTVLLPGLGIFLITLATIFFIFDKMKKQN